MFNYSHASFAQRLARPDLGGVPQQQQQKGGGYDGIPGSGQGNNYDTPMGGYRTAGWEAGGGGGILRGRAMEAAGGTTPIRHHYQEGAGGYRPPSPGDDDPSGEATLERLERLLQANALP